MAVPVNQHDPLGPVTQLTLSERLALAAASIAIHELPSFLQQASDAADMQTMLVDPSKCYRGGFILAEALGIFYSYSGWRRAALDTIEVKGESARELRQECEKFIARAVEQSKISGGDECYFDNGNIVAWEHEQAASPNQDELCQRDRHPSNA
jgi:hypothetical protein